MDHFANKTNKWKHRRFLFFHYFNFIICLLVFWLDTRWRRVSNGSGTEVSATDPTVFNIKVTASLPCDLGVAGGRSGARPGHKSNAPQLSSSWQLAQLQLVISRQAAAEDERRGQMMSLTEITRSVSIFTIHDTEKIFINFITISFYLRREQTFSTN